MNGSLMTCSVTCFQVKFVTLVTFKVSLGRLVYYLSMLQRCPTGLLQQNKTVTLASCFCL